MTTKAFYLHVFLAFSGLFFVSSGLAAEKPVNVTTFGHLALHGYDAVAYFTEHKPVEGKKDFTYDWHGAKWRFVSAENLARFQATPDNYAPQYGGYCAYAVSNGDTADIDPEAWDIVNDKLYLNYDKKIQTLWRKDRDTRIIQANLNWPKLIDAAKK